MKPVHQDLAAGRWHTLSLAEQMGNVGSEVSRALKWQEKDPAIAARSLDRALELMEFTLDDSRWRAGRLRELARVHEVLADAILGGKEYESTLSSLDAYFTPFAVAARAHLQ